MSGVRSTHEMRQYSSDIINQFRLVTDDNDLQGHHASERGRPLLRGFFTTEPVRRDKRRMRLILTGTNDLCNLSQAHVGGHFDPLLFHGH